MKYVYSRYSPYRVELWLEPRLLPIQGIWDVRTFFQQLKTNFDGVKDLISDTIDRYPNDYKELKTKLRTQGVKI